MIPWPQENTNFVEWANSLKLLAPEIDILPIINDENLWKDWGNQVIQSTACQTSSSPRTDGFDDWRLWAVAFIRSFATSS